MLPLNYFFVFLSPNPGDSTVWEGATRAQIAKCRNNNFCYPHRLTLLNPTHPTKSNPTRGWTRPISNSAFIGPYHNDRHQHRISSSSCNNIMLAVLWNEMRQNTRIVIAQRCNSRRDGCCCCCCHCVLGMRDTDDCHDISR